MEPRASLVVIVPIISTLIVTGVRYALNYVLGSEAPLMLYTISVIVSAYYMGWRSAIIAVVLALVVGTLVFVPAGPFGLLGNLGHIYRSIFFIVIGLSIAFFMEKFRRAQARIELQLAQIQTEVAARCEAEARAVTIASNLRIVTDRAPVLIAHCDRDYRYKFVNRPYAERFGYTPEEVVGRRIPEIIGEAAFASFREKFDAALNGTFVEFEMTIDYARVGPRTMFVRYNPEYDEQGAIVGLVAIIADVTERNRATQELAETRHRLERITEASPDLIYLFDLVAHRNIFANHAVLDTFGMTTEQIRELSETDFFNLIHPEDRPRVASTAQWLGRIESGGMNEIEYRLRHVNGSYRWLRVREVLFSRTEDGAPHVILGVGTDVSAQKHAEELLRQQDRRKDEFLATLAHELRNPLAPLSNGLNLLRRELAPSAEASQTFQMMSRQMSQLIRLVDDLLDVSRISSGKLELRPERVTIAAVLEQAIETSRPLIDAQRHHFQMELPPGDVWIDADVTRLAQVFANLINNSSKYTRPGGRIRIHVNLDDSEVAIAVCDNGIGIPPTMLGRVFDIFTQVNRTLERTTGGLGIGLSLVKGLVEMHGGSIVAHSEGEGLGSRFTVRLPLHPQQQAPAPSSNLPSTEDVTSQARPCLQVLVVDDHEDGARSLAMILEILGHTVAIAHDGQEAIAEVQRRHPDVILMDLGMPRMNGYEACQAIRQMPGGSEIVMVALTGWGQDEDRRRTAQAGFDHHLVKPVDVKVLENYFASLPISGPRRPS